MNQSKSNQSINQSINQWSFQVTTHRKPGASRPWQERTEQPEHSCEGKKSSINQSINQWVNQSVSQSVSQSINQSMIVSGDYTEEARSIPALTGTDRTTWARVRKEHFSRGLNKESIDVVEKAIFHVSWLLHLRIEFRSGCIYGIMNAMVKLANPWSALALAKYQFTWRYIWQTTSLGMSSFRF